MNLSKKWSSVVVLSVAMSLGLAAVQPKRAEAFAGGMSGNGAAILAGAVAMGTGLVYVFRAGHPVHDYFSGDIALGIGLSVIGLVLLDSQEGPTAQFTALSTRQAQTLGISKQERDAYNDSVEEVNAVGQDVALELSRAQQPTVELSKQAWLKHSADLDVSAAKVASLIAARALENAAVAK